MPISGARAAGDAISNAVATVAYDIGATATFADVSTWAGTVTVDPRTGDTAMYKTFLGDPVVFVSRDNPFNVAAQCLYTEGATDPFLNVFAAAIGSPFDIQITPIGDTAVTGDLIFTTNDGLLMSAGFPAFDANSVAATTFDVSVFVASMDQTAVV